MAQTEFSLVVTTYNNAATLAACLQSVRGAAEILVLDSGSQDGSRDVARECGAHIEMQPFQGYGPQKQAAVNMAKHDWVLLLDADEVLSASLAREIELLMHRGPDHAAYRVKRREQLFWRWQHPRTKFVEAIRLFDRRRARLSHEAVHAGVVAAPPVGELHSDLLHFAETDVHTKVSRLNNYSSGMARERLLQRPKYLKLKILFAPCWAFWREYLLRRQYLNGWAGFIAARSSAFYTLLKHAKILDLQQDRHTALMDSRPVHYRAPGKSSDES